MRRVSACPACGGRHHDLVVSDSDAARQRFLAFSRRSYGGVMDEWLSDLQLRVLGCHDCGHFWYEQQPDDDQLVAMYEAMTPLANAEPLTMDPTPRMMDEMRCLHRLIRMHGTVTGAEHMPTMLDYGSGFGRWARAAAVCGFQVVAYEPSRARGEKYLLAQAGIESVHDLAALEGRRFDAINLEQVLEHIHHPVSALVGLKAWSHEKTVMRVAVPNVLRCPEGSRLWETWPYDGTRAHSLAPFEHLHGFSPNSLRVLAHRAGLALIPPSNMIRVAPAHALRAWIGRFLPKYGQTLLYASLA
jgi:hypothetical protein